jgi:hypothetical protein
VLRNGGPKNQLSRESKRQLVQLRIWNDGSRPSCDHPSRQPSALFLLVLIFRCLITSAHPSMRASIYLAYSKPIVMMDRRHAPTVEHRAELPAFSFM